MWGGVRGGWCDVVREGEGKGGECEKGGGEGGIRGGAGVKQG